MSGYRRRLDEDTDLCSSILWSSSTVNGRFGSGTGMGSLVPWRRARAVSSGIVPGIVEFVCPMILEEKYSWRCDVEMWVCALSSRRDWHSNIPRQDMKTAKSFIPLCAYLNTRHFQSSIGPPTLHAVFKSWSCSAILSDAASFASRLRLKWISTSFHLE